MYIIFIFTLDKVIWECNVYNSIVPEKCRLFVRPSRLEVRLKKRNPKIYWITLHNEKVCSSIFLCVLVVQDALILCY